MKVGYTYIMGSHTGTLYVGVTGDIYVRVQQHKDAHSKASQKNTAAFASSTTKPTKASLNP
jgi:predicted GIY-YIG superfamily endonuclease